MDENIQPYREPMVNAIGIILGFVLGFAGNWAKEPVTETDASDYLISIGLLLSIILLILALFRMLNNQLPKEKQGIYYRKTLMIFITGIVLAFLGILVSIFQTILSN